MLKQKLPVATALATAIAVSASGPVLAQERLPDNDYWWPNRVSLEPLRKSAGINPLGDDFDYAEAFESLDLDALHTAKSAITSCINVLAIDGDESQDAKA